LIAKYPEAAYKIKQIVDDNVDPNKPKSELTI
jgi:hypothetical protein